MTSISVGCSGDLFWGQVATGVYAGHRGKKLKNPEAPQRGAFQPDFLSLISPKKNVENRLFFPVFSSHKGGTLSSGSKNPTFFFDLCPKKCRMSD